MPNSAPTEMATLESNEDILQWNILGDESPESSITIPGAPAKVKPTENTAESELIGEIMSKGKEIERRSKPKVSFNETANVRTFDVNDGDRTTVQFGIKKV